MSGNLSTDYLAALQNWLDVELAANPSIELGQRQAIMGQAAQSLARVIKDPGLAWTEIDTIKATVADQARMNENLTRTLGAARKA
jgi:hypothetical protein